MVHRFNGSHRVVYAVPTGPKGGKEEMCLQCRVPNSQGKIQFTFGIADSRGALHWAAHWFAAEYSTETHLENATQVLAGQVLLLEKQVYSFLDP